MSKKQLQVEGITNELAGASSFFAVPSLTPFSKPPATQSQKTSNPQPTEPTNERSNERTVEPSIPTQSSPPQERTVERTDEHPVSRFPVREKVRHSFDVYADQLISLRELAVEQEKIFGSRVLMGDLVQQAIDMLLTKERNR